MYIRRSWSVLLSHPVVRYPNVKCQRTEFRIWNVGARNFGYEISVHGIPPRVDWAMLRKGNRLRTQGVGTPLPSDMECVRLSGFLRVEGAMLQGGPFACARCRDPSLGWHGARIAIRRNSIRIPQGTRAATLSGYGVRMENID